MKNKRQIKKVFITVLIFSILNLGISYFTDIKINALQNEKTTLIDKENTYPGDSSDPSINFDDDIVIKIINKIDSSIDIKYVNKFDKVDKDGNKYLSIELSLSGNINKIKSIENIFNDLKLNYEIEDMQIKTPKGEKGNIKNYVDCTMMFKVR